MKVACDIDGVLSDFSTSFLHYVNKNGWKLKMAWWNHPGWLSECPAVQKNRPAFTHKVEAALFKEYTEAGLHEKQDYVANNIAPFLIKHETRLYTLRPMATAEDFQTDHDKGCWHIVYCTTHADKAAQAKAWGAQVFIDDAPEACSEALKFGIPIVVLWATRHNEGYMLFNRVETQEELEKHIASMDYANAVVRGIPSATKTATEAVCDKGPLPDSGAAKQWHGHPRFYELLNEMRDLHDRKNHDYAGDTDPLSNLRMCEMAGLPAWQGVIIRLMDKMSRLMSFMKQGELRVKDESVEDTFSDMAVYAVLGRVLFEESRKEKK